MLKYLNGGVLNTHKVNISFFHLSLLNSNIITFLSKQVDSHFGRYKTMFQDVWFFYF